MKELLRGMANEDIAKLPDAYEVKPDYSILEGIKYELGHEIYGQDKAMEQLAMAVTRSWAGFSDPKRPEGVFMFLGPTGVGKTESAKALARYLHPQDWEKSFLRIDCTQLQESHSVGRLKGSEPSYVGYGDNNILITPSFLSQKDNVIVFDEIEKAHPNVWRWLLPVMEEGQQKALTPATGGGHNWSAELATLNFANSYLIFTSNVGAGTLHKARLGEQGIGFHRGEYKPDMNMIGKGELRKAFEGMPEFLGRLDSTIVFEDLQRAQLEQIFNKFMDEINEDQRMGQNYLAVTRELRDYIIDRAETGEYGAREIRHKIDEILLSKASAIKFSGVLKEGQPLIGCYEGEVKFKTVKLPEAPKPPLHKFESKKKDTVPDDTGNTPRDAGSYIGNKPDEPSSGMDAPEAPKEPPKEPPKNPPKEPPKPPSDNPDGLYQVMLETEDGKKYTTGILDKEGANYELQKFAEGNKFKGKIVKKAILLPRGDARLFSIYVDIRPNSNPDNAMPVYMPNVPLPIK